MRRRTSPRPRHCCPAGSVVPSLGRVMGRGSGTFLAGTQPLRPRARPVIRDRTRSGVEVQGNMRNSCRGFQHGRGRARPEDRKSVVEGKSVSVRVDLGGSRIMKKNKKKK